MERLSGMDASFLYLESARQPMNVVGIIDIDPSTMVRGYDFESMRAEAARRVSAMPVFRRKLRDSLFNLGHPVWVEDNDFDIERHVHRGALPTPGGDRELAEFCAHIAASPLARDRPLWDMWIIEGRPGGRLAVMLRVHHCCADGRGGAELIGQMCSLTPEPPELDEAMMSAHAGLTSLPELIVTGASHTLLRRPPALARMLSRTASASADWIYRAQHQSAMPAPFSAPRTPFNGSISAHRSIAFTEVSLTDVTRIASHFGVTINDLVLAVWGGVLREHLAGRDSLPGRPLVAMVPVSLTADMLDPAITVNGSNQVTGMFVNIPTHLDDPVERVTAMAGFAATAKRHHATMDPSIVPGWAQLMPARTARMLARIYGERELAQRHPVVYNLVMSNVRGPDAPLYFLGARVSAMFPLGPVFHGAGVNITVFSMSGHLNVGVLACREQLPDPWPLVRAFERDIKQLLEIATSRDDHVDK